MINNPQVPDDKQLNGLVDEVGILDLTLTGFLEDGSKDLTNDRVTTLDLMLHRSDSFKNWLSEQKDPTIRTPYPCGIPLRQPCRINAYQGSPQSLANSSSRDEVI